MRLVFDLPRKDGLPVPGFHMHAIEGRGVPLAELASHNYAVRSPCFLLAHHIPPWSSYRRHTLPFYGPKYAKPSRIFVPTATSRVMLGQPRLEDRCHLTFGELRFAEVQLRRISLPRTPVNK